MASPRLGAPMQRNARPQDGRPNATRDTSASWEPQRNARHVRKLGAPTHICNANARHVRNARHVSTSAIWAAQRNARHVCKLGTTTQHKARRHVRKLGATTKRKAHRHFRNVRHVGTSANWAPQRNARHVCKMVAQTQNSSAMKTSTQGSTRLKDKLEDG
jgi:hypothetical protein